MAGIVGCTGNELGLAQLSLSHPGSSRGHCWIVTAASPDHRSGAQLCSCCMTPAASPEGRDAEGQATLKSSF